MAGTVGSTIHGMTEEPDRLISSGGQTARPGPELIEGLARHVPME